MVRLGVYAAAAVISLSASVEAFTSSASLLPHHRSLSTVSRRRNDIRSGGAKLLRAAAPTSSDNSKQLAGDAAVEFKVQTSLLPPVVEDIPWRQQSPYRNNNSASTAYLNQFPNTWVPAESLAEKRSREPSRGAYVSTSGIRLQTADLSKTYDAAVVGTGPAGVALALQLAREGMSVSIIGPIGGAWPNNYGVWLDEWEELGLPDFCLEQTYASTRITISASESIGIPRAYGKVNGNKLRQWMLEQCAELGVHVLEGIVCSTTTGKRKLYVIPISMYVCMYIPTYIHIYMHT